MSINIAGSSTGNGMEVDTNNNAKVNTPRTQSQAGFVTIQMENDPGTYTGTRDLKSPRVSQSYKQRVGVDTPIFNEMFQGASLNSAQWNSTVTTMTTATSGGFLILNSGNSVASAAVARVQSYRHLQYNGASSLELEFILLFGFVPQANNICEWGIGFATTTTAPTDGIFFRLDAAGAFTGVSNFNGSETSVTLSFSIAASASYNFKIFIHEDVVSFIIDDVVIGNIVLPVAGAAPSSANSLPILLRTYNTGTTASAQQMKVSLIAASHMDANSGKPWPHVKCGEGFMGYQGQTGGTMGTTALYTNSLAPGAGAVMTNTTAALGSGLGGQFACLPTLAANTDGILSSYQNPVGTAALPAKTLYITGIRIQGAVTTVLVGNATPTFYAYSLAFGHTAVSLATAEAATTKAPRRIALGYETYAAAAALGTVGAGVSMSFLSPVVVNPGEFVQVVAKNVGVVTTTGVITFLVTFDCYWE